MTEGRRGGTRREPTFGPQDRSPADLDLRLTSEDRPGGSMGLPGRRAGPSGRERQDPSFRPHIAPGDDPLAEGHRERRRDPPASREAGRTPPPDGTDPDMARQGGKGKTGAPAKSARATARGSSKAAGKPARRRRSLLGHAAYWTLVLGLWAVIGLAGLVAYHASKLPPIDQLAVPKRPPNIAIVAADGSLIANRGETGGRAVSLRELPPYLPKAFVAIEDRRFFAHWGVDPVGIARAVANNLLHRGGMQGGSTLTQQLAKNLFLTQERTASRKIQEAILALWLERNYSKDQILELYLNRVYFGSGAYGVEAAAQKYYGKSAKQVTLAEAATLAGLVQAPSRLAPNRNPEAAQARAALVIAAMAKEGLISDQMAKVALMNPPNPVRQQGAGSMDYAADYVMDVLDDFVGTIDRDIVVSTTIDPPMQGAAEKALVDELAQKGAKFDVSQGAFIAMTPDGGVRALVGGRNYADSQFNRATAAKRQPGSAFKPFVYLTAVEQGLTPDTIREDAPITVKGWSPENYSRDYRGPVSLRTALALSLNTVAVRLGIEVGPKAVVRTAQRLGIQSKLEPNASIALGTSEVTPIELVSAYAPFANGGILVQPYVITQVKTSSGERIYTRTGGGFGRAVEMPAVGMMNAMMRETLLTGTARKADLAGWEAAGKTGTSQDFRDAWFVGYTGTLVAGVWLGNDDGSPTKKVSGGNLPVEVWSRFMKVALAGQQPVPLPGGSWKALTPAPAGDPNFVPAPPSEIGAPVADAQPQAPRVATGAGPLVLGPSPTSPVPQAVPNAAQRATTAAVPRAVASDDVPRPPGAVGGQGSAPVRTAPRQDQGLLSRLFGG